MRKLLILSVWLIVTSCAITVQPTGEHCWNNRICTGDLYFYHRTPYPRDVYQREEVKIIAIQGNRCQIRRHDGIAVWVDIRDLDRNSEPRYRYYDRHQEIEDKHHDNGKHKGQHKHGDY